MSSPFLFDPTNLLVLPSQIMHNFSRGDWKGAYKRAGIQGVLVELLGAATGFNCMAFFVAQKSIVVEGIEVGDPDGRWTQRRVRGLLAQYGVRSWAYGYWFGEMHFMVEKRQMDWAQYVMLRAGTPLLHGLLPGSRAIPPNVRWRMEARQKGG